MGLLAFISVVSLFKTVVKDVLMRLFLLSCVVVLLSGCGKVTQVTAPEKDTPVFDLTYSVSLVPTAQMTVSALTARTVTANRFSLYDKTVYAVVYGISPTGEFSELAWGRSDLTKNNLVATPGATLSYRTSSFRKDGVVLDKADYKWAKLTLSSDATNWGVKTVKLKRSYPLYMMATYSPRGVLFLKAVSNEVVSGNAQVSVSELSFYDTFVSVLYLMALSDSPQQAQRVLPSDIQSVFTPDFFATIRYGVPDTSVPVVFDSPRWIFDRPFERQLLSYFYLVREGEFEVAGNMLPVLVKTYPAIMTDQSAEVLSVAMPSSNQTEAR